MSDFFMVFSALATVAIVILVWMLSKLNARLKDLLFSKQSLSARYGRITEQFFPLMDAYPYDGHNFRFIGSPIDGVQFNDDSVVFVEFKSSGSRMTPEQRRIRQLVEDGKVEFRELRAEI